MSKVVFRCGLGTQLVLRTIDGVARALPLERGALMRTRLRERLHVPCPSNDAQFLDGIDVGAVCGRKRILPDGCADDLVTDGAVVEGVDLANCLRAGRRRRAKRGENRYCQRAGVLQKAATVESPAQT